MKHREIAVLKQCVFWQILKLLAINFVFYVAPVLNKVTLDSEIVIFLWFVD